MRSVSDDKMAIAFQRNWYILLFMVPNGCENGSCYGGACKASCRLSAVILYPSRQHFGEYRCSERKTRVFYGSGYFWRHCEQQIGEAWYQSWLSCPAVWIWIRRSALFMTPINEMIVGGKELRCRKQVISFGIINWIHCLLLMMKAFVYMVFRKDYATRQSILWELLDGKNIT